MISSSSYNKSQKSKGMTKFIIILSLYSELHYHKRNGHPKIVCLETTNAFRINGWPVFVCWLDLIIIRSPSPVSPGCSSRSLSISVRHDEAVLLPFLPAPTNFLNVHQFVQTTLFGIFQQVFFLEVGCPPKIRLFIILPFALIWWTRFSLNLQTTVYTFVFALSSKNS